MTNREFAKDLINAILRVKMFAELSNDRAWLIDEVVKYMDEKGCK